MKILLFGPPGMGKSTLVGLVKSAGTAALDLEDVKSNVRYQLPNMMGEHDVLLGAADLDPKRTYPGWKKLLLVTDQETYDQRRAHRDAQRPGKANQAQHTVDAWKDGVKWDYVFDTSSETPAQTSKRILALLNEGKRTSDEGGSV